MAGRSPITLVAVDAVEVKIIVDGFVDVLMADAPGVERYRASDWGDRDQLLAEHGFAALVTVTVDGDRRSILYDGGLTPTVLGRNLDVLGVRAADSSIPAPGGSARSSSRLGPSCASHRQAGPTSSPRV